MGAPAYRILEGLFAILEGLFTGCRDGFGVNCGRSARPADFWLGTMCSCVRHSLMRAASASSCCIPRLLALHWQAKKWRRMPERPDPTPDVPLPAEALAELRQRYGMLSKPGLQQVYADALERCRLDKRGRPPRA